MHEIATGAITFLFTDVEGSTALLKQLRERYADGLAAHQRLVREAFARRGGRELDTQGDAFFFAFPRARDAVLAAVDAQQALRAYATWPDGAEFKVRMGVHTGQAEVSDGRYTGLAVHRAARICAAAHGGQVLVSQATETLLADEEEDLQVRFRPLGEHRLKDLDRPVSLYQVAAPDLPSKFPAPREQAPAATSWLRKPIVLVSAALVAVAAAAIVAVVALGSGSGGLAGVDPNNVGVIDAETNEIVAQVPVGIRPGPISAAAGDVWVGNLDDRTLTRLDARKRSQVANVPLDNRTPTGLAATEAAAWVAQGRIGSVARVDPQYNQAGDPTAVTRPSPSGGGSVALGGGSVWAVFGNSTLVRIDPDSGRVAGRGYAGSGPSGITYAEEAVWVANGEDSTYSRFNPETFETGPVETRSVGSRPTAIAYGEGSIWTANAGDGTVWRINPASLASTAIRVGGRPSAIAVGEGAAWVASSGEGTVSRIDPKTNTVVKTIHTGNLPAGLAVGNGFVWVTVQAD